MVWAELGCCPRAWQELEAPEWPQWWSHMTSMPCPGTRATPGPTVSWGGSEQIEVLVTHSLPGGHVSLCFSFLGFSLETSPCLTSFPARLVAVGTPGVLAPTFPAADSWLLAVSVRHLLHVSNGTATAWFRRGRPFSVRTVVTVGHFWVPLPGGFLEHVCCEFLVPAEERVCEG